MLLANSSPKNNLNGQDVDSSFSSPGLHKGLPKKGEILVQTEDRTRADPSFPDQIIDTKKIRPREVVAYAKTLIGIRYRYGSTDPLKGFDCSGFITYLFNHFGIQVPRSSIDFTSVGKAVPLSESRYGDLILFTGTDETKSYVGHMGLIVKNENGNLEFIHSTSGKAYGVTITSFNDYYRNRYVKTVRIFPNKRW
ncbi:MAG: hypothetical protein NVS1B13_06290 [Flavisolibacter sp.]